MKFSLFGTGLFSFYLLFNAYIAVWTLRNFRPGPAGKKALAAVFIFLASLFPLARWWAGNSSGAPAAAVNWLGFAWLGGSTIFFFSLLSFELLLAALKLCGFRAGGKKAPALALAAAGALFLFGLYGGMRAPDIRRIEIKLKQLPPELDGMRVAQVSDTHFGRMNGPGRMERLEKLLNALNPDLVVFTGDILEGRESVPEGVCKALGRIKARLGKPAVPGNHDLFGGRERSEEFFERCGLKVLRGESYEPAPGLVVAGLDYLRRGSGVGPERLARDLPNDRPVLLLSHLPQGFEALMKGRSGLVLAGHTHKGQIFPFTIIERPFFKYFYGLYREGDFSVYVTAGAGTWGPPLRLFAAPEIPLFTLRADPATP